MGKVGPPGRLDFSFCILLLRCSGMYCRSDGSTLGIVRHLVVLNAYVR